MLEESRKPRDEMMEEIKAVRAEIHRETEGMTSAEKVRWYNEGAKEFAAQYGYEMVPSETHPNAYKLVRRTQDTPPS